MRPILLCLALCAAARAEPTRAEEGDAVRAQVVADAAAYRDPAYAGPLDDEGVRRSDALAVQFAALLPGPPIACGVPDPLAGTLIAEGIGQEATTPDADPRVAPFAPLLALRDDPHPEVRALATRAIGRLGPRARFLSSSLKADGKPRDAWAAEAAMALDCANWSSPGRMFSGLTTPPGRSCDEEAVVVFFAFVQIQGRRHWPRGALLGEHQRFTQGCGPVPRAKTKAPLRLLVAMAIDPASSDDQRRDVLDVMEPYVRQDPEALRPLLPLAAGTGTEPGESARWNVIMSGLPEGARLLAEDLPQRFHWGIPDLIAAQATRGDDLAPVLVEELGRSSWGRGRAIAKAFAQIHAIDRVDVLLAALSDRDWMKTWGIAEALGALAPDDPRVVTALSRLEREHFSLVVRQAAQDALRPPPPPSPKPEPEPVPDGDGMVVLDTACLGDCTEHGQARCADGDFSNGAYVDLHGTRRRVHWHDTVADRLPRGVAMNAISSWCHDDDPRMVQRVPGGWLVGCLGTEYEGAVAFKPEQGDLQRIERMGVSMLLPLDEKILVGGISPLSADHAGVIYSASAVGDGTWALEPFSLIPQLPTAYARFDDGVALKGDETAVFMRNDGGVERLDCAH